MYIARVMSSLPPTFLRTTLLTNELTGNLTVKGTVNLLSNLHATYFIGNGAQLSGLDQASLPPEGSMDLVGNVIGVFANLDFVNVSQAAYFSDQVNVAGNVAGNYFVGNGTFLEGVLTQLPSTANVDIVGNVSAPGEVVATGNVQAHYFVGNGATLEGVLTQLPATANIDIVGNVSAPGEVVATGNVQAQYFVGNGATLEGVLTQLPTTANIDIVGNVSAPGDIVAAGNVQAQYFVGNGALLEGLSTEFPATANIDIVGNVSAPGDIVAAGNVAAGNFVGNGAFLEGVLTTFTRNAEINIFGNVVSPGDMYVIGNVSGSYFIGSGALLTGVLTQFPASANIDIVGNVSAPGDIVSSGNIVSAGNVSGAYFIGNGATLEGVLTQLPTSANLDIIGNVSAPGGIVAVGNVVAENFVGNGAFLEGVLKSLPASANIDISGNVIATNVETGDLIVNSSGVINGALNVLSNVTTSGYFVGNGHYLTLNGLTLIPNGNVANAETRLQLSSAPAGSLVTDDDTGLQFLLTTTPGNVDANWMQFASSSFIVPTVFGRTGAITAFPGDYNDLQISLTSDIGPLTTVNYVGEAIGFLNNTKANIVKGTVSAAFRGNIVGEYATVTTVTGDLIGNVEGSYANISTITGDLHGNVEGEYANISMINGTLRGNVEGEYAELLTVTADSFIGDGSLLTGVTATLPSVTDIDIRGNVIGSNVTVGNVRFNGGNLTATHVFGKQTGLMWNSVSQLDPRYPTGNVVYTAISAGPSGRWRGTIEGYLLMEYGLQGRINSLNWDLSGKFDFSKDFELTVCLYINQGGSGGVWGDGIYFAVGGSSSSGVQAAETLSNGALIGFYNNYLSRVDLYLNGASLATPSFFDLKGPNTFYGKFADRKMRVETIGGRRYLSFINYTGQFLAGADITGWVPSGAWLGISGKTGGATAEGAISSVVLKYI